MGYSCTKDASDMLGLIRHEFTDGETGNGLRFGATANKLLKYYEQNGY